MVTPRAVVYAMALCALCALPARGEDPVLQPSMQGSVAYVSGGIGDQGQRALREVEGQYNLRLLFAVQGSGEYLADIPVRIVDAKGVTVLDAVAEGPFMLVKLPPGVYSVIASNEGAALKKSVTVPATAAASQAFYWPASQ